MKAPAGGGAAAAVKPPHDSLRTLYLYTEAVKRAAIYDDNDEARRLLLEAAAADSAYAPAWYMLARTDLADMLSDERTAEYARRAYMLDTAEKRYADIYARTLILTERYGEALPLYERLIGMDRNPEHYRILALLYKQHDRPFSAIAILDSADGQFGPIPLLTDMKRQLLLETRQYDRALEEALRAAEARPYDPENYTALGQIYDIRGDDSLALANYRRAVAADSSSVAAWAALGDYYVSKQNFAANLDVTQHLFELDGLPLGNKADMFDRITANRQFYREYYPQINRLAATLFIKYPDARRAVTLYADHLIASGETERALEIYKSHLDDTPPQLDYYTATAVIESYLGRPDSADFYLARAAGKFPDNPEVYIRRGGLMLGDGREEQAIKEFRTAMNHATSDIMRSEIWGYIGDARHAIALKSGKGWRNAYADFERALKAWPDNAMVLNNYAYYLSLEGRRLNEALAMSERAVKLSENNASYLDTQAWVLYRLGRYEEARSIMRQALSLDRSNSPELRLHYGDILAALGDRYMAEVYWRRAIESGHPDRKAIEERMERLKNDNK